MVSILKSGFRLNLGYFIRSLLRNQIQDPKGRYELGNDAKWIFKDNPELDMTDPANFPVIIVSHGSVSLNSINYTGTKFTMKSNTVAVTIFDFDQKRRDELGDSVYSVLKDPTKEDADGDSFNSNRLKLKKIEEYNNDYYIDYPKMLRVREIILTINRRNW